MAALRNNGGEDSWVPADKARDDGGDEGVISFSLKLTIDLIFQFNAGGDGETQEHDPHRPDRPHADGPPHRLPR